MTCCDLHLGHMPLSEKKHTLRPVKFTHPTSGINHLHPLVAHQCSKRALVFELVAPPLEQILLGSKHLGEYCYICVLCVRKSFCSVARATEPSNPPLRL